MALYKKRNLNAFGYYDPKKTEEVESKMKDIAPVRSDISVDNLDASTVNSILNMDDIAPVRKDIKVVKSILGVDGPIKTRMTDRKQEREYEYINKYVNGERAQVGMEYGNGKTITSDTLKKYAIDYATSVDNLRRVMDPVTEEYKIVDVTSYKTRDGLENMSQEEISTYNNIYNTKGADAASAYLDSMQIELSKRGSDKRLAEQRKKVENGGKAGAAVWSAMSVPMNVYGSTVNAAGQVIGKLSGKEYNPYTEGADILNRANTIRSTVNENMEGKKAAQMVYNAGMSAADNLFNMANASALGAGKVGTQILNSAVMGASTFGSTVKELKDKGVEDSKITAAGLTRAGIEAVLEYIPMDNLLSMSGAKSAISALIKGGISQAAVEGSTEGLTELATTLTDRAILKKDSDTYQRKEELMAAGYSEEEAKKQVQKEVFKQIAEAAGTGAIAGGAMGSVANASATATRYTENEKKVIDAEVKKRISEQETDGKKLSKKEKAAVEEQVRDELEKGYISIDSIESALGGDTYNSYKALSDEMDEYTSLNKMKYQEMTGEQSDRLAELKEKNKQNPYETEKARLKERLAAEVNDLTQNDAFLRESYNEKSRRGQAFEADLTKYKSKEQQAIIQKAIESKILNNTRRTHEFVDMISKIAADKGVSFDFTNNEKLKESGFAMDGKTVNGYVQGNNISLNIQSAKSLNKVVGHEITHVLEGTELYTELQKVVKEYATTKGEYATRLEVLQELYKDVEDANIENELTADLIGDYLFTDEKFINNLSTKNPNIFKKIYEEIKYLVKVATAGSKEAKELEKVKRIFEKAYKQSATKNSGAMRFSLEIAEDGTKYVDVNTEQDMFVGLNESESRHKAREVILDKFAGKIIGEKEAQPIVATKRTAKEYAWAKKRSAQGDIAIDKMKASTELDNLLEASEHVGHATYEEVKEKHPEAVGGIDYYKTIFKVSDRWYEGIVNVINSKNVRVFYDVTKLKSIAGKNGLPVSNNSPAPQTNASDNIIPESQENSTNYSLSSMANTFFGNPDMSASEFARVDYRETQGYKDYVEQCVNNYRQTRKNFVREDAEQEIRDAIDGIVQVAIAAKKAGYDIYDDNTKRSKKDSKNRLLFSSLEPNSDYFTSSDISTICDKRQNFAEIYDDIVRAEEAKGIPADKRFFNNVDNYFYLHKIMAEKGLTQPCRQCYVESMRKNLAPMASAFLRLVNETDANNTKNDQLYNQKGKDKGKLKTNNAKLRERVLEILGEYDMTAADLSVETLTTEDGLAQLKIQAPMLYEAFNSFYGQSKPKMPKSATPFRFGELTALLTDEKGKIKQSLVDKINSTGGFRLQSYSDFQIQNFTDVLQVIFEAGTLGLNGHAYTKVPAFLDATEGTNLKRNISIFMYKDGNEWKIDRNDSFPYTLEEIYDIVDSDKDGNTGIIAVSQNDEMSAWIMANDRVGYGIPFHKSGVKMGIVRDTNVTTEDGRTVKGYKGIKDHTRQQTEVWKKNQVDEEGKVVAKANTKVSKGINIYEFWDFDNKKGLSKNELIKKNLKAYINACEKAGYLPKFRDYVINNGKMLNDVLGYSKELGMVSQEATIDDISFTYKGYRIPYGYYKFLGDFGMFTPDGFASPHEVLSLKNYDFKRAKDFFKDAESLRRNEILQQFSNGQERENYRKSNLTAEQLAEIVKKKRGEVADNVITRHSLSEEGQQDIAPIGNYNVYGSDIALDTSEDIAPVRSDIQQKSIREDIAPVRKDIKGTDAVSDDTIPESPKSIKEVNRIKRENYRIEIDRLKNEAEESHSDFNRDIADKQAEYDSLKNKNTNRARSLRERIDRLKTRRDNTDAHYERRINRLQEKAQKMETKEFKRAEQRMEKQTKYRDMVRELIGDTSGWRDKKMGISYQVNTLKRNLRDIVKTADGKPDIQRADAIYDEIQGKYNHNEALLNTEARRIKAKYKNLKINSAEDAYIQMLGEYKYNPDCKLTSEEMEKFYSRYKDKIDVEKVESVIEDVRKLYDELYSRVNEVLREHGMKEIGYREGYFPHFTEDKQGVLARMLNWKVKDNSIPTDIAGLTENFNPERSWQSFNKHRTGDKTDYSFQKGLDAYVNGALDWIYHIEDLQKRRAFENEIRYQHSDQGVKDQIEKILSNEELDADEAQEQIDLVYKTANNPLNNFITDFRNATNNLAGKKSSADRTLEYNTNRKIYSVMTNISNRVSANMVAGSVSSALTNFIPITQSWSQVTPVSSLKAMRETIKSYVIDDGMIEKSDFMTNRLRPNEQLYQTFLDKAGKAAGSLMEFVDNFTTQVVWRSKYMENMKKGMAESDAVKNADNFAEGIIAGRSRGNMPTIFNSKNPVTKLLTAFQLEVSNQYAYMFKDLPQDVGTNSKGKLIAGYASMFLGAYAYNALYSQLTGRNAAFDPVGIIMDLIKDLSDEDKEPLDSVGDFAEDVADEIPFIGGLLGGGRVPISAAFPYDDPISMVKGTVTDAAEGNWKQLTKEWLNPVFYVGMPFGGGQNRKTIQGLKMFDKDLPVSGSYTDSGNLRFPVEDTVPNKIQAAVFGQYANKNARQYFDNDIAPLNEKQIQEYKNLDIPIGDYWKYREGLSGQDTLAEKADYINSLDIPVSKKNIMINNVTDRKEAIDMSNYDSFADFEEFDFYTKNKEKYQFLKNNNISYKDYIADEENKEYIDQVYSWTNEYPEKYAVSKAVTDDVFEYKKYTSDINAFRADKDKNGKSISGTAKKKVIEYLNSLDIDEGAKYILFKIKYPQNDDYNMEIIDYLNERDDISAAQMRTILEELDFQVDAKGNISW